MLSDEKKSPVKRSNRDMLWITTSLKNACQKEEKQMYMKFLTDNTTV